MRLTEQIKQKALALGFDLVGITDARPVDSSQVEILTDWLETGCAAGMSYMHRNFEKRIEPAKLLEDAKSVICVGLNYKPPPQDLRSPVPSGKVATYAQYQDYHTFIKKILRELIDFICTITEEDFRFKICVDSAPLAERALAARAGLGFIGKNHMLINPTLGPQIFLGEILTTLKLPADEPDNTNCSNCTKCIRLCPTGALQPEGRFDANKCISYLTIEHKGDIPPDSAERIGDHLFGCDECLLVCPYHQKAPSCANERFKLYNDRANLNLHEILNMSNKAFDEDFADSVISRPGLEQLKRNAGICLKNARPDAD